MTPIPRSRTPVDASSDPPIHRALDQSERVKTKVEQAARELSAVNAALTDDVATGAPLVNVRQALDKSEAVELKVQEAAEELVAVNDALADEVAERNWLEDRVREGAAALSASQAAEELARHRALHDAVTTLPNGTLFADRLESALEQARRHHWRLAVMFLDLDGFKQINDAHGHDLGDHVLQLVAKRLVDSIRAGDSVGRRGGDEFLVLMLELQDDVAALVLARKLATRLADPMQLKGVSLSVGASIGVAVYPDDAITGATLLRCADEAMYVAKRERTGVTRFVAVDARKSAPVRVDVSLNHGV